MHHALEIQEILLNIFGHYYCGRRDTSNLASLARTCRAFKEPALDVLWEMLVGLSPLAQCLPEASHQLSPDKYSFSRLLTQTEWDILRSYTRRIRSIVDFRRGLNENSLRILLDPPSTEPLFPNLRYLNCKFTTHLLHLPLPSLISIDVDVQNPHWFQDSLNSFPKFSPNIRNLSLSMDQSDVAFSKFVSNCICRWRNLQTVICPLIALDMDALVHLSHMPALIHLDFALSATLPASDSPLFFSNLHELTLQSESLGPISRLLSLIRLPATTYLTAIINSCPSRQELSSFLVGVQTSSAGHTIKNLELYPSLSLPSNVVRSEALLLCLEDLRPCMALSNLCLLHINIEWNVSLTDSELVALASALPHLEQLVINAYSGWNTLGGITPNGLLQLLQTCPSLSWIALAIDTRGYTELPPIGLLASLELTLPRTFYINVLDSIIEAESVPAVAAFFAGIAACCMFSMSGWIGRALVNRPGWEVYRRRWDDVIIRAKLSALSRNET